VTGGSEAQRAGGDGPHIAYITGVPRSGSTVLARILAAGPRCGYVHEPFNPDCGVEGWDWRFAMPSETVLASQLQALRSGRLRFRTAIYEADGLGRRALKRVVGSRGRFHHRLSRLNPWETVRVIKDPTAPLISSFLTMTGVPVVFIVRHPGAIVRSYASLGWSAFDDLERLRRRGSGTARAEVARHDLGELSAGQQVALLWTTVIAEIERDKRVRVARYEDIMSNPAETIPELARDLSIPWGWFNARALRALTSGGVVQRRPSGRTQQLRRNSVALGSESHDLHELLVERDCLGVLGERYARWYPAAGPRVGRR
jgi:hypothetical protein